MKIGFKHLWILSIIWIGFGSMNAQTVSGTVTEQNTPLPGVNVLVKGTQNGTSTDFDGNYLLDDVPQDAILQFVFLGMKTVEISVDGRTTIDVVMEFDSQTLEEVVITGYGQSESKRKLSTAISTVSSKQIEEIPVSRPEALLQGTAPGVVVQQTSGQPGAPLTVRIRGVGSPNNSQPLYIVDGLPVPNLQHLNSDDIASMNILKDAASAAIYGSRGGNGVVLVETKKGRKDMDKPNIDIHAYAGMQSLANKPDLMNRDQYLDYYNQAVLEANGNLNGNRGAFTEQERQQLADTDWYDSIFESAPMSNISAAISDGGEKIDYAISGGMFDQEGVVGGDAGKSNFNRRNIHASLRADLFKNFQVGFSADVAKVTNNFLQVNSAGTGTALMNYINAIPSIYPTHAENGELFNMGRQNPNPVFNGVPLNVLGAVTNPLWSIEITNNEAVQDVYVFGGFVKWQIIDDLDLSLSYSSYKNNALNRSFTPEASYPEQTFSTAGFVNYSESPTDFTRQNYGGIAEYNFSFLTEKGHNLRVLGGFEVIKDELQSGGMVQDFGEYLTNDFDKVNFALSTDISDAIVTPERVQQVNLISFFGRATYDYKGKFLATATLRNDSSSNFGENNRSGWFPSGSFGWVMSEEDFLSSSSTVNLLKLRASYGLSGTDASPRALAYQSTVTTRAQYAGNTGIALTGLANPDLKWEELSQLNFGVDFAVFDNSLNIAVDYYIKETKDILLAANTPLTAGLNPSVVNVGNVKNNGIEFTIGYNKTYDKFSWNTLLGVGYNKNEVTSLGNNGQALQGGFTGQLYADPITLTAVGQPISSFYGYKVEGIDAAGNLLFEDLDGSGNDPTTPNADDKTFIGKPLPDFTAGWTIGASYAGFDLNAFFYGAYGNDIFDATIRYDAIGSNRPTRYLEEGAPRNMAVAVPGDSNGENLVSDFHVQDGSYVRLKTLTLGYSLPESVNEKINSDRIRVYISGLNLFTMMKYTGVDPEIGEQSAGSVLDMGIDRGFYPQSRGFLMGLQFNF